MKIEFIPIGYFKSSKKSPYEAARQAATDPTNSRGIICLEKGKNFKQALKDLEGISHIWILYHFHHNKNWKPMVLPPRGSKSKVGVFATRAPYRPNGIGLSLVKLSKIENLNIHVENHDILDGTPVLDIKPYLAYSDSVENSKVNWLENIEQGQHQISFSNKAQKQIAQLEAEGLTEIRAFIIQQLEFDPINKKKKRVKISIHDNTHTQTHAPNQYVLSYKTWRIGFSLQDKNILIKNIFSQI